MSIIFPVMLFIDLSHPIENKMPVFPGTPEVKIKQFSTIAKEGYAEKELELATHIGTHMDAPAHMIDGGKSLDEYQISDFTGRAFMIPFAYDDIDDMEQKEYLSQYENEIRESEFIILKTGWSEKWGTDEYFKNYHALDKTGAEYLSGFRIKGIGLDAISIDQYDNEKFDAHYEILGNEILIIENLTNLDKIRSSSFKLYAFPLRITDADGSPLRVVAEIGD